MAAITPGPDLNRAVLAGFILQGSTLGQWCRANRVKHSNARACLFGSWNGPKARELRQEIVAAAGLKKHSANAA